MGRNTKINISIVVISTLATFIQTVMVSISAIYTNIIFQIATAILNAVIVALESLQINIKRIKTRENSINNSLDTNIEELCSAGKALEINEEQKN